MSIFDTFFLGMMIPTFIVAAIVIGFKFVKDMLNESRKDRTYNKAVRNTFQFNRSKGAMAVRNK